MKKKMISRNGGRVGGEGRERGGRGEREEISDTREGQVGMMDGVIGGGDYWGEGEEGEEDKRF